MARQIDIISTSTGTHYVLFGMDNNELAGFSIMFWITKYGARMVDWVQAMGLNFISFMGADLWIHNDEDIDRCKLFGEKRDCIVGVISNEEPTKIKVFDAVGIHSDDSWEITEIVIPATSNYPHGMYSRIPPQRFKKRDGVWRAEFLRNMKTGSNTISTINALSGEPLRGYQAYMLLKNTSNNQVKLFKVDVNATQTRV